MGIPWDPARQVLDEAMRRKGAQAVPVYLWCVGGPRQRIRGQKVAVCIQQMSSEVKRGVGSLCFNGSFKMEFFVEIYLKVDTNSPATCHENGVAWQTTNKLSSDTQCPFDIPLWSSIQVR